MKRFLFFCVVLLACLGMSLFVSCYEPSPLYGNWSDNVGNSANFMSDGTFMLTIKENDRSVMFGGTYSVLENTISFSYTYSSTGNPADEKSYSQNSEWDIRGSILYINWTDQYGQTIPLTLYHVSK